MVVQFTRNLETWKLPLNLFTRKSPYVGKIKSVEKLTGEKAKEECFHVVIDHQGRVPYWEGQTYGIIPPGSSRPRFYSLASSRYGDEFDGKTAALCVKRCSMGGICSGLLCDSKPGDNVNIVGPFGKTMLLNEEASSIIMVGTGTGVAPYRGFLRRMFLENVSSKQTWLFMGARNLDSLLYHQEFQSYLKHQNFRYDVALSQEDQGGQGAYVQDKVGEKHDEVMKLLENGGHIYFCGRKDMMSGIQDVFRNNVSHWDDKLREFKKQKRWHVDVY